MLPSGAIARGSRVEIAGVRLGAGVNEIKVSLTQSFGTIASGTIALAVIEAAPGRIEAFLPAEAPLGPGKIVVTRGGQASKPFSIQVAASSFGIFSENGEGWGPARFAGASTPSLAAPAKPGAIVTIAGTGLGVEAHPQIFAGGRQATIVRVERKPLGLDQITFRLPAETPEGCFVPLYGRSPRAAWVSNAVTIPVSRGGRCAMAAGWPLAPLEPGKGTALAVMTRESLHLRTGTGSVVTDHAIFSFTRAVATKPVVGPVHLMPPPGTCTTSAGLYDADLLGSGLVSIASVAVSATEMLDAGLQITLTRPGAERVLSAHPGFPGLFAARLGSSISPRTNLPLFLDPGQIAVTSPGGPAVGPLHFTTNGAADFTWVNRYRLTEIDRKTGFEVQWKDPHTNRFMLIFAVGIDRETRTTGLCVCRAAKAADRFFIGPDALANFPAVGATPDDVPALVGIAAFEDRPAATMKAKGIETGFASTIRAEATQVAIR